MNTIDISKPQFKANPYPFYAHLRAEQPVFAVKIPDGQTAWLITRYDDALAVLKDKRFSKDKLNAGEKQPWMPAYFKPLSRNMLDLDDPDHARLRGLVHKAFTPNLVENMRRIGIARHSGRIAKVCQESVHFRMADSAFDCPGLESRQQKPGLPLVLLAFIPKSYDHVEGRMKALSLTGPLDITLFSPTRRLRLHSRIAACG